MSFLKRHWRKFVLTAFATLWTGCAKEPEGRPEAIYGCPPEVCSPADSSAINETSPEETNVEPDSSSAVEDSAEEVIRQPAIYGPPCVFDDSCDK